MTEGSPSRRPWFAAGAASAAGVALLFATLGDGVSVAQATGLHRLVVDHGHTLTWVLLASALGVAAVAGRWTALANRLGLAAGACYLAFLAAVLAG